MSVKPLGERILVKPADAEVKTSGGIYIPDTAQEKTQEAIVVAIGDGEKIKVKIKDRIIHDKYSGTSIKVQGQEHILLKAEDVLAVITE